MEGRVFWFYEAKCIKNLKIGVNFVSSYFLETNLEDLCVESMKLLLKSPIIPPKKLFTLFFSVIQMKIDLKGIMSSFSWELILDYSICFRHHEYFIIYKNFILLTFLLTNTESPFLFISRITKQIQVLYKRKL